jgi:DNA-binding CsgD family transcriptional regulator
VNGARGATGAARGEVSPSPFAVAPCRRSPDGQPAIDFADGHFADLLGLDPASYLRSPAGQALASMIETVLSRIQQGEAGIRVDLRLEDPTDKARALHCRLQAVSDDATSPSVLLVLHDLTPQLEALRSQMSRTEDLFRLLRLSEILLEHRSLESALESIVDEIATSPGISRVAVGFREQEHNRLRFLAHRGLAGRRRHVPFTEEVRPGPCADALGGESLRIENGAGDDPVRIHVPIRAGQETFGVLMLGIDDEVTLDRWGEEILGSYADYLAALVANAPAHPRTLASERERSDTVEVATLLTERQQEVLYLLVNAGATNRTIAERLGTTEATVKVHMRAIFDRLHIDSRAEALHLVYSGAPGWLAAQRARREQG